MALVLLFLAVLWVGAGIYYYRGRPEGRSADSIGSFRHQLRVLERTGPTVIDPAHRMGGVTAGFSAPTMRLSPAPTALTMRRRQVQKRRRDVFFGLLLGLGGAVLLGFLPGLQAMWMLAGVLAVVLVGYVALLVQLRSRAAERSAKVHFLPENSSIGSIAEPAVLLLRRSAN